MTETAERVHQKAAVPDLDEHLATAHPENELIALYGPQIIQLLESKDRYLRTIDAFGWIKWVRKDAFLRRIRSTSPPEPRNIAKFRQNYGDKAFEAVKEDIKGFRVDFEAGKIHTILIDRLSEVEAIVTEHYRTELLAGRILEIEPAEWMKGGKSVCIRIHVNGKRGRYVGVGGERIKWLNERIRMEVGVEAMVHVASHVKDGSK